MVSKYTYKKLSWIDLENPTKDEVFNLVEEYDLPRLVAEELLTSTVRSKVDFYNKKDLIYLVLHFPIINAKSEDEIEQEIDFVIGKDFIITTHYEMIDPLHKFSKIFDSNDALDRSNIGDHAGYLFLYIIKELYKFSMEQLEDINYTLKEIEKSIFNGHGSKNVALISSTNRKLLNFKQALRFHGEVLKSFESAGKELFGSVFTYNLSSISSEYNKVRNMLDGHKEILNDLRDTNDSLLSTKTNETIKTLTIMTFIMLPITLITGVFGMNVAPDMIFIQSIEDFLFVLGAMTLTGLVMFVYFKGKKWL